MRLLTKSLLPLMICAGATQVYAGAWTEPQGDGLLIVSGSYYDTSDMFNTSGQKIPQSKYSQYNLNPYLEYGLRDWLTLGANLSAQHVYQNDDAHLGLGDSQFFARARLWQQGGFIISAEPMIKLPASYYSGASASVIGSDHPDAGLGINGGYGFTAFGLNHFVDIDTGYRYRFGPPDNQLLVSGTLGVSVTQHWMIMPQIFMTYNTGSLANAAFTESPNDDYNLIKLQLSAVYKLSDDSSLQLGGFSNIAGKNTGSGNGMLAAIWKKF